MEAFRVMPFVQLCILNLLGISCCRDCMFGVAEVCVCVCLCVRVFFSLSHTHMQNYACTKTHTRGVFHLRCEARPPSAFLTCNHVQICTGRQGEGESHVNLCGCFLFCCMCVYLCVCVCVCLFAQKKIKKTRFWLPPISDTRDPNHLLKPLKKKPQKNRQARKNIFSLSVLFQLKSENLARGGQRDFICQVTST